MLTTMLATRLPVMQLRRVLPASVAALRARTPVARLHCSAMPYSTPTSAASTPPPSTSSASAQATSAASAPSAGARPQSMGEDTSRVHPNTKQASMQFARWLAQHGMRFSADGDPRPLFGLKRSPAAPNEWVLSSVGRPIKQGDVLCSLPLGLTLSPDSPLRNPLAAHAITDGPDAGVPGVSPLTPLEVDAGSELRSMIDRVPASLWPLKGGLRLLFEFALQSGSRSTAGQTGAMPGAEVRGSFFAPYIHMLPNSFDQLPLFWSVQQVAALQYEPLAAQLRLRSAFLRSKSAELSTAVHVFGSAAAELTTPERLAWAMSCVSSRAFQLRPDASHCSNLPLIDMLNHSYDNNCKVTFEAGADGQAATPPPANADAATMLAYYRQPIRVVATRDIPPHTELTLNYGWHANEHLLLNYGFLLDENPADVLEARRDAGALDLAVDMAGEKAASWDTAAPWQRVLAQQQGLSQGAAASPLPAASADSMPPFRLTRDQIDPQLIALVHVMLADPQTQPADKRHFAHFLALATPNDIAVASAAAAATSDRPAPLATQQWIPAQQDLSQQPLPVLRVLYAYVSLLQSSFPTTLAQDVEALANVVATILAPGGDRSLEEAVQREELAIRFRIGKKRILAEQLNRLQKALGDRK